jgi:PAS domain S-box-containing protein
MARSGGGTQRFTLSQKGLLIVAASAAFQIALLLTLFAMERAHNRERDAELRSKETVASAYRLLGLVVDTESSMRGYLVTHDPVFLQPYERAVHQIPQELQRLRALARGNLAAADIERSATYALAFQTENRDLMQSGAGDHAQDRVRQGIGKARMDAFRVSMQRFLNQETRAAAQEVQRSQRSHQRLNAAVAIGTFADILISVMLIVFLSRKFGDRLSMVIENTRRIERREKLLAPLRGNDEIGNLDRRVHEMAEALDRAQRDLDQFFTVSLEMLCIAGFDGFFKRLNPVWETILGYSNEELRSRPFIEFVHPDDRERTTAEAQRLGEGFATVSFENRYRCADGSYRWLLWNAAALPESQLIFAAATDITERKEFEHTLHEHNAALEVANHDLESFSYTVSHDLRAPLRAVDGYARILAEEYAGTLDQEGLRFLTVIRSEARRMGTLIDDLLSFSRLGRQSLSASSINLRPLAEEVMREIQTTRPDRTIHFISADLPPALADRATIRQVLVNLLSNAAKYAKPDGEIRLELGGERDGQHNIYWVRDNGIGFDMRYAEKVFGVFQRLHADSQFEGTGVGLAIVERIIARHGGRVWVEAEPGKGATFFFSLPASDSPQAIELPIGSKPQWQEVMNG